MHVILVSQIESKITRTQRSNKLIHFKISSSASYTNRCTSQSQYSGFGKGSKANHNVNILTGTFSESMQMINIPFENKSLYLRRSDVQCIGFTIRSDWSPFGDSPIVIVGHGLINTLVQLTCAWNTVHRYRRQRQMNVTLEASFFKIYCPIHTIILWWASGTRRLAPKARSQPVGIFVPRLFAYAAGIDRPTIYSSLITIWVPRGIGFGIETHIMFNMIIVSYSPCWGGASVAFGPSARMLRYIDPTGYRHVVCAIIVAFILNQIKKYWLLGAYLSAPCRLLGWYWILRVNFFFMLVETRPVQN